MPLGRPAAGWQPGQINPEIRKAARIAKPLAQAFFGGGLILFRISCTLKGRELV